MGSAAGHPVRDAMQSSLTRASNMPHAVAAPSGLMWRNSLGALALVFSGIAMANIILALQHAWLTTSSWQDTLFSLAMGVFAAELIWRGLQAGDVAGSIIGYAGGALLWMGFLEWSWANFPLWLGIDPLVIDGQVMLPPSMLLVQASAAIFLPLVILTAANKDTRCRMMIWLRRRLHLPTPARTPHHSHNSARVSATETLFVIWFIYLLNISLHDPRLLGREALLHYGMVGIIAAWGIYLLGKLLQIRDRGLAIRYAIPTAYLLSIPVDAMSMAGWFPAVWVQPLKYPVSAVLALSVFIGAILFLLKSPPVRKQKNQGNPVA